MLKLGVFGDVQLLHYFTDSTFSFSLEYLGIIYYFILLGFTAWTLSDVSGYLDLCLLPSLNTIIICHIRYIDRNCEF